MSEQEPSSDPGRRPSGGDRVAQARRQLAGATAELQKAIGAIRDPGRRREVTSSYIALLQKSLAAAQQGLERYERRQSAAPTAGGAADATSDLDQPTPPAPQ